MSSLTKSEKANATRRDFLRRASTATAAVAVVAVAGTQALASTQDAELRRLWSEYLGHVDTCATARKKMEPARAAFDAQFPPCPDDVLPGDHWCAHDWLWQKHDLQSLSDAWHAARAGMRETIDTILQTKAEGLFGIGVKLAAMTTDQRERDLYEYEDAVVAVFDDIDRLLGSDFALRTTHDAVEAESEEGAVTA
jgi:hypothetical protein